MKFNPSLATFACAAVATLTLISHQAGEAEAPATQASPALSKADADGVIFERQQIMLQLGKDSELLGDIAAGLKGPEKLAEVTRSIADSAKDAKASFAQNVPGGRSKPEVWSNAADYGKRMDDFVKNTEEMAKLGEAGNLAGVTSMLATALPCKECHDVYRAPKKPAA